MLIFQRNSDIPSWQLAMWCKAYFPNEHCNPQLFCSCGLWQFWACSRRSSCSLIILLFWSSDSEFFWSLEFIFCSRSWFQLNSSKNQQASKQRIKRTVKRIFNNKGFLSTSRTEAFNASIRNKSLKNTIFRTKYLVLECSIEKALPGEIGRDYNKRADNQIPVYRSYWWLSID